MIEIIPASRSVVTTGLVFVPDVAVCLPAPFQPGCDTALRGLPPAPLPAEIAVLVLAEFIRNPKSAFEHLARVLAYTRGVTVEVAQIERLFDQNDLKKTM